MYTAAFDHHLLMSDTAQMNRKGIVWYTLQGRRCWTGKVFQWILNNLSHVFLLWLKSFRLTTARASCIINSRSRSTLCWRRQLIRQKKLIVVRVWCDGVYVCVQVLLPLLERTRINIHHKHEARRLPLFPFPALSSAPPTTKKMLVYMHGTRYIFY